MPQTESIRTTEIDINALDEDEIDRLLHHISFGIGSPMRELKNTQTPHTGTR
jgi:hypothetical protein